MSVCIWAEKFSYSTLVPAFDETSKFWCIPVTLRENPHLFLPTSRALNLLPIRKQIFFRKEKVSNQSRREGTRSIIKHILYTRFPLITTIFEVLKHKVQSSRYAHFSLFLAWNSLTPTQWRHNSHWLHKHVTLLFSVSVSAYSFIWNILIYTTQSVS